MTTLAVVYGRNSSAKQKSIADQLAACVAEAKGQGWLLAGDPLSDKTSASRYATKARANWERLLKMLPTVDVVVLWEPSRGDRTLGSWVSFVDSCRTNGVRIHAVSHSRTYDPRNARDYRSLAEDGVDSAYESDKISARVLRGHATSALAGRPHSPTTYGYKRVYDPATKAFVRQEPHPGQATVVRDIIESIGGGESLAQVVLRLNRSDIPTQRGGEWWYHSTVRTIATNVAYRPHPDDPKKGTRLHRGAEHVGQWPPLVTRSVFEAAAKMLGANSEAVREARRKSPPGVIKYLLSGNPSVATARCGSMLTGFCSADGRGATYGCKMDHCSTAPMPDVDKHVARLLRERLARPDARDVWLRDDEGSCSAADELASLLAELEDARQSFAKPGGISAAALAMKEAALLPAIADAQRRATPAGVPLALLELIDAAEFGSEHVEPVWDALPILAKREVIALVFEELSLCPATVRLTRWSTAEERLVVVAGRVTVRWRA